MTFGKPAPTPHRRHGGAAGALAPTLIVLGVLVVLVLILAQVWTEVLWYRQLGFTQVHRDRVGHPRRSCSCSGSS